MLVWLVRILGVLWAGFWISFGLASAIQEHLAWYEVALWAFRPGLVFLGIVLIAWFRPRLGGVLLALTGFVLAGWYAIYYGARPANEKLFVLATFALPPLACGLMLLWLKSSRTESES